MTLLVVLGASQPAVTGTIAATQEPGTAALVAAIDVSGAGSAAQGLNSAAMSVAVAVAGTLAALQGKTTAELALYSPGDGALIGAQGANVLAAPGAVEATAALDVVQAGNIFIAGGAAAIAGTLDAAQGRAICSGTALVATGGASALELDSCIAGEVYLRSEIAGLAELDSPIADSIVLRSYLRPPLTLGAGETGVVSLLSAHQGANVADITAASAVAGALGAVQAGNQMAATASVSGATDPYWSSVVLLIDASGYANGTTPSDIDVTGKTPAWTGNAQCKTDQFKFGASSLYFDGAGDCVYFADSPDWFMGTGDATWEMWVRPESGFEGVDRKMLSQQEIHNGFYSVNLIYDIALGTNMRVTNGSAATYPADCGAMSADTWYHVALVRAGTSLYGFLDGARTVLEPGTLTGFSIMDSAAAMVIGGELSSGEYYPWKGWIDQVRITKGVARYTADFTPPAAAFPHS